MKTVAKIPGVNESHVEAHLPLSKLRGRTVSGGLIAATSQSIQFALNLLSVAVLARLLTPRDFGLVAMVLTFAGFLRIFKDMGLSTATVQRDTITHAQVSNLFWINVGVGGLMSAIMAAGAPVFAWFYREPRITNITLALSGTFFLSSISVQHLALLARQLRFKGIALTEVTSLTVGVLVGIGMAWLKFGPWSLVGVQLTVPLVSVFMSWSVCRWRPQLPASRTGVRPMVTFGANMTASSFMGSIARGGDGLLVGRFYGPDALGFYSRGSALLQRPLEQFMAPMNSVFVPVLSRLQSHPERYRRTFLQVYEAITLSSFLITALFLPLSRPLTLFVLGGKWEKAASVFACFALGTLFYPPATAATWLFASQGRGKALMYASFILSSVTIGSFVAGLQFGPVGVALAFSVSGIFLIMPIIYFVAGREGPVGTKDLWVSFLSHLPVWGVVTAVTWLVSSLVLLRTPLIQLLVCGPVGLITGALFISFYAPARTTAVNFIAAVLEWRSSGNTSL